MTGKRTDLAIVIPVYKKTFIRETLESLANQSDKRFNVYIGNDAGHEEIDQIVHDFKPELNITYASGDLKWQFTLKGESLNISSLKTPNIGSPETNEDVEGFVLEKNYLYEQMIYVLENLYAHFIKLRVSDNWQNKVVPRIRKWLTST